MDKRNQIDLLLIGKTGNGKSSTGNSILSRRIFQTSGSSSSETRDTVKEYSKYKGRLITVVDSPGVGDTRLDKAESVKMVTEALNKAIVLNPQGYHALLIAIKYGNRFTGEENDAIEFLKQVFGPNFVRDFCIIVMCRGDDFIADHETTGVTFESWCQKQSGQLKELIDECGGRIVLFNNRAKDRQTQEAQVDQLINIVDNLTAKGQRYTNALFNEAKETRDKIIKDAIESIIKEEQLKETSLIFQKLEKIQDLEDEISAAKKLNKLKKRCQKLLQETQSEFKGENTIVQDFIGVVSSLNRIIDMEIQFYKKLSDGKDRNKTYKEEMKKRHKEEIISMKEQLLKQITTQMKERDHNVKLNNTIDRMKIEKCIGETVKELKEQLQRCITFDSKKKTPNDDKVLQKTHSEMTSATAADKTKVNEMDVRHNVEAAPFSRNKSDKGPTVETAALKETIKSALTPIIIRQLEEKNTIIEKDKNEKLALVAEKQNLRQEMELAKNKYINVRDVNTQSFLSRAWAWITRPIRALVNWIRSKLN